ncbi:MAG: IS110 family transposase [Bacillota bacterium]
MDARPISLAEVSEAAVIVGVDVAKYSHWARVIDPRGGELVKPVRFENSRVGFSRLDPVVAEALHGLGLDKVVVGLEPSGHYWKPLAHHFHSQGVRVVLVNPYHVKQSKELDDNSHMKSDRKDALVVASLVQQGRFLRSYFPEGVYADLRVLVGRRSHLKRWLNSAANRLWTSTSRSTTGCSRTCWGRPSCGCCGTVPFLRMCCSAIPRAWPHASRWRRGTGWG